MLEGMRINIIFTTIKRVFTQNNMINVILIL